MVKEESRGSYGSHFELSATLCSALQAPKSRSEVMKELVAKSKQMKV